MIVRAQEALPIPTLIIGIYGEPGSWKTSLAFTAENPLLIDFDRGAHRTILRKDTYVVQTWKDAMCLFGENLSAYDTIVIDTIGRALDLLSAHLVKANTKNAQGSGQLTQTGYGALKSAFMTFITRLRETKKDIVIIAHAREDKKKGEVIARPDAQGASKDELYKMSEALGYLYMEGENRVLSFIPCETYQAKDAGNVGIMYIPDLTKNPRFLADIIKKTKSTLHANAERSQYISAEMEKYKAQVAEIETANQANNFVAALKKLCVDRTISFPVFKLLTEKTQLIGLDYDQKTKIFSGPPEPVPEESAEDLIVNSNED